MASSSTYKQDLPPEGGYRKLDFARLPAKKIWAWWAIIPTYCISTAVGIYLWRITIKELDAKKLENTSATIAIMPLIIAEKDRLLLKNMRKIREEEADVMKNVEGWETGTLYGEKVYKTVKEDEFILPNPDEYYGHTRNPTKDVLDKKWFTFSF